MTKKKTIITSLGLFAAAALIGVGGALALTAMPNEVNALTVDEKGYTLIYTKEDLDTVLDDAQYNGKNIRLMNDIDYGGVQLGPVNQYGFEGYTGTFDGNGHTIYGISTQVNSCLFQTIDTNAVVKDLSVELVNNNGIGGDFYGLCWTNNGTVENVKVVIDTKGAATNSAAAFSYSSPEGSTYIDCDAIFIAGGGNTMFSYFRDAKTSNPTFENCTYKAINATGSTIGGFWEGTTNTHDGISEAQSVVHAYVTEKTVELVAGTEYEVTATGIGLSAEGTAVWESDSELITISNDSTTGATLTATEAIAEPATVTVTYTDGEATESAKILVTAIAATDVSAIEITAPEGSEEIELDETVELTAALTGTVYESITWESSNPDVVSVAQSEEDPLKATITGLAISSEPVTITATVKVNDETSYSDEFTVNAVTELDGFYVSVLIADGSGQATNTAGVYINEAWSGAGKNQFFQGEYLTINGTDKAKANVESGEATILRSFIPTRLLHDDQIGYVTHIQFGTKEVEGYWGTAFRVDNFAWNTSTHEWNNVSLEIYQTDKGWDTRTLSSEYTAAFDYLFENFDGVRTTGTDYEGHELPDSICGILDDAEKLDAILTGYEALTEEAKAVLETVKDPLKSDPESTNTISDTIAMLISESNAASGKYAANALNPTSGFNTNAVIVLVTFGAAALLLTSYFIVKRKRQAK